MATGDILSVTITDKTTAGLAVDGFYATIEIEGFTTGKAIDFGSGFGNELDYADIGSAKIVFTVVSEGYNSSGVLGTVTRTLYATKILRKPYPNEASNDEPAATTIRVALSDFIYNDDKNGGAGTSGTDPTVTIAAGCIRNDGGLAELNNAATALAVTNASTLDYPQVIGQWDHIAGVCTADRVKANFNVAFNARHRSGIAAVLIDATGQTSLVADTSNAATLTMTQRTATSLYADSYVAAIPIAQFTQGELITLRARAYPVVGDADSIIDTNARATAAEECLGYNDAVILCDKSDALDDIVYVSTTGNDTTGDGSEGNPYATIGKGISQGNIVYLTAGTHLAVGSTQTRKATNEWVVVQPAPGLTSSDVTVQVAATVKVYRCSRLRYHGVTVTLESTSSWLDGEDLDNFLRFTNCVFDSSGVGTPTTSPAYRSDCTYFENCTGDMGRTNWALGSFSTARVAFQADGVVFSDATATASSMDPWYRLVACRSDGAVLFHEKSASNAAPAQDNLLFEFNEIVNCTNTGNTIWRMSTGVQVNIARGMSVCGNVIEKVSATTALMQIAADSTTSTTNHVILWHNTFAGERLNIGYNDVGTTAYAHVNYSQKFNSFRDWNNKDDTFGTGSANRTGSWAVGYGVGFLANNYEISTFPGEAEGFDLTTGSPGYVDDQGNAAGGSGNGDYHPAAGSTLLDRVPAGERVLTHDLYGTAIADDGTGDIGGVQGLAAGAARMLLLGVG